MVGVLEVVAAFALGAMGGFGAFILLGFWASVVGAIVFGLFSGGSFALVERREHTGGKSPPS